MQSIVDDVREWTRINEIAEENVNLKMWCSGGREGKNVPELKIQNNFVLSHTFTTEAGHLQPMSASVPSYFSLPLFQTLTIWILLSKYLYWDM